MNVLLNKTLTRALEYGRNQDIKKGLIERWLKERAYERGMTEAMMDAAMADETYGSLMHGETAHLAL